MIDRSRLAAMHKQELDRFVAEHPRSMALREEARGLMPDGVPMAWMNYHYEHPTIFAQEAEGVYITDVDGHRYLDMNLSDMSMATGYGIPAVADVVDARFRKGSQMLLPTEDCIAVAREMALRFGKPSWQFTLAASNANTETLRLARAFTGRDKVMMFDGKYHGHIDAALHGMTEEGVAPEFRGLPKAARNDTVIAPFNDIEAVEAGLSGGEVACLMTEPAFTTVGGLLMPEPGFHDQLREVTRKHGTLLIMDETHTNVAAFGGLSRAWGLESDMLVLGKTLGGGIPIGAYGLSDELHNFMEQPSGGPPENRFERVASGGTLFANALQMAATRVTLEKVLTSEAQEQAARLGGHLVTGMRAALERKGVPWSVWHLFNRASLFTGPDLPKNFEELARGDNKAVRAYLRTFMVNRGIWEAVLDAGPAVSIAAEAQHVESYIEVFDRAVDSLPLA